MSKVGFGEHGGIADDILNKFDGAGQGDSAVLGVPDQVAEMVSSIAQEDSRDSRVGEFGWALGFWNEQVAEAANGFEHVETAGTLMEAFVGGFVKV